MMRSMLRKRFLQNISEGNPKLFCKQRNKRISFLQKSQKGYCKSMRGKHYRYRIFLENSQTLLVRKVIFLKEKIPPYKKTIRY